ncbi:MAG: hypothetical protein K0S37_744 [Microbacterium sp.]|jgi:hypothetical protein|nr:hypothetical protein [Microbacterium sp.]
MSQVYFGNRAKQAWIPGPKTGMDWSVVRRSNVVQLENGGVYTDDSIASHREGLPEWEAHPDELRFIRELYNGVWGPGPYFWVDPFAANTNLLSPSWATPGIITDGDWPQISAGTAVAATVAEGLLGVPTKAATYSPVSTVANTLPPRRFTILIPPGHQLAFGSFGSATGTGRIALRGTNANGTVSNVSYIPLDPTGLAAWHATNLFPHSAGFRSVNVFLARSTIGAGSVTLAGMRAVLVRETDAPPAAVDPFVSGEGAGALRFAGNLRENLIYAPPDPRYRRKAMSVRLIEVGDWE